MPADNALLDLYLVTDETACLGRDIFRVVEEAVKGGVTLVQLREKTLSTRAFTDRALRMKDMLSRYNVPLIINDRIDVALAAGADGVHVGQSDMHYHLLRKIIPADMLAGISAERQADVTEAAPWKIDYLAVSPLFSTPTKTDTATAWGMDGLRWVRANSRHPLVVIGGLHAGNVAEAVRLGASGIAVVSAICSAPAPGQAAELLRKLVTDAKALRSPHFEEI